MKHKSHKLLIALTGLMVIFWMSNCAISSAPTSINSINTEIVNTTSLPLLTRTPIITMTAPVATPPSLFDLPDWMSNPQTDILADLILKETGQDISAKLSFLNALTEEWYDIQIPLGASKYFWFDNMHFGFLSNDFQGMHLIDLSTGYVSYQFLSAESTRLLATDNSFSTLQIKQDPLSPNKFIFDYAFRPVGSAISINTLYSAEKDRSQAEEQIVVTDLGTGQLVWQSNPSDGYQDNSFAWSPVNNSYLAMVVGKSDETSAFGFPVKDTTLIVLDVRTGEMISLHKGDIGSINWSPDGTRILYKNALSPYWNFGHGFTEAPCIFNIQTREESCIWNIPNRPLPNGYTLITTDDYQWNLDGKSIFFVYSYSSPNGMVSNLCFYNLLDGNFTCPTDNLSELTGWGVDWQFGWRIQSYNLSPDEEYIQFCYSSNHPLSDDQSGPSKAGLIDINGTRVISWVEQELDGRFLIPQCSYSGAIWRPLP